MGTRRRHGGWAIALAAVLTLGLGACGGSEPTSIGAGSSRVGGSVPTTSFVDNADTGPGGATTAPGATTPGSAAPDPTTPATSAVPTGGHIPSDPDATLVTCAALPATTEGPSGAFPFGAVARAEALGADDPLAAAFEQATIRGGQGGATGRTAPVVLARTGGTVVVGNAAPPGLVALMTNDAGTGWQATWLSACPANLPVVLPAGTDGVTWRLDPTAPPPGPADTTVRLWLRDDGCPGDTRLERRLRPTEVVVRDGQVLVGITADPPESGGGCSSNEEIPVPLAVELPGPLGDRVLADGLTLPPRPAS